jgi:hypothetical protein
MMMSTRPEMSVGMRLGVVTQVRLTFFLLPKASCAKRRATCTSYPSLFPRTSMNPNGGKSHLTPISHFFRFFTADGRAGSFGFTTFGFGFAAGAARLASFPPGAAIPQAANAAVATSSATTAIMIRFIQPLLL